MSDLTRAEALSLFDRVQVLLGNPVKALAWFSTSNPLLGDVSPNEMLAKGQVDRLMAFIREAELAATLKGEGDE